MNFQDLIVCVCVRVHSCVCKEKVEEALESQFKSAARELEVRLKLIILHG